MIVLTRESALGFLDSVTVAPVTGTIRRSPSYVPLTPDDGLFSDCAANLDGIQTVLRMQLGEYITHLSANRMQEIRQALAFALALE